MMYDIMYTYIHPTYKWMDGWMEVQNVQSMLCISLMELHNLEGSEFICLPVAYVHTILYRTLHRYIISSYSLFCLQINLFIVRRMSEGAQDIQRRIMN